MSRISQDFINSVGYLYEEINVQQNDFLNEESENYDAEMTHMVEDILSTVSVSMIYEGYSASAVIGFLADSSEQDILEKYLTFDENILLENTISEEYIQEQLEIFDYCIDEGLGSLIGKVAKGAVGLAGRVASKPARTAVAKKLATSTNPEKTRAAMQRLAQREARKGNVGGYSKTQSPIDGGKLSAKQSAELLTKAKIGQVTQKVKDIATKAKPVLQKVGKGAAVFGLGAAGGYMGAKMAGAGSPTSSNAPGVPSSSGSQGAPTTSGGGGSPSGRGGGSPAPLKPSKPSAPQKPKSPAAAKSEWEKANPRLAQAEKLRQQGASREDINKVLYNKGTAAYGASGQSQMEKDAEELRKMTDRSKQRQGKLMGGPEGPGTIDTKSVEADIKAAQERQKKQMEQQKNAMTAKESYEPYDIVLDYLFSNGHADTLDEANYIMMEMDEDAIGTIIEQYEYYLLAEEVEEWVDGLVNEGYDLSEYTWDDIMEYYVNEAKEDKGLTPLQKIRKRNKNYAIEGEPAGDQTSNRRAERSSQRGVKKTKGEKSAFGTMRHVGGPYN